jgi:hypothetical protein
MLRSVLLQAALVEAGNKVFECLWRLHATYQIQNAGS